MVENDANASTWARITKEQRIGFVLLFVFTIVAIALGLLQIRNNIVTPFALNDSIPPDIGRELDTADALRYRDTDRDGLSDFDELYVYSTSQYIPDTDSDGVSDKSEVDSGQDPLCAKGSVCVPQGEEDDSKELTTNISLTNTSSTGIDVNDLYSMDVKSLMTDPATVRKLLLNAGLDEKILDGISDEVLLKMVGESMNGAALSGNSKSIEELNKIMQSTTTP